MLSNNHKGVFVTLIFPTIVILSIMFTATTANAQQVVGSAGPDQTVREGQPFTLTAQSIGVVPISWSQPGVVMGDLLFVGITANAQSQTLIAPSIPGGESSVNLVFQLDFQRGFDVPSDSVTITVVGNNDPVGKPTIDDTTPTEGQSLTADPSAIMDADVLGTFSYQWLADGVTISGATSSTLLLTQDQLGAVITVMVSYRDGGGTDESVTSAATGAVIDANIVGTVTITGTAAVGQILTATVADSDGLDGVTIGYKWLADGVTISGATSSTLLLTQDQLGAVITVMVSYRDGGGTDESVTSAATGAVIDANIVGTVTITGTAAVGQILTATVADSDGLDGVTIGYKWLADGVTISGATSSTLLLTQDQLGAVITVMVSYRDGGGTDEILTSAATAVVVGGLNQEVVTQLHKSIMTRFTQVVVANTNRAVEGRIDAVFLGAPQVASYTLDGQTVQLDGQLSAGLRGAMMNKLPTYAKSWQDGTLDWKQMLSRSSFVLPLNATGGDGAGNAGLTVWGSGDYTNMSGKEANLDWDGNVTGFQLGVDGRRDDVLAGGLVSFSKGSANYTQHKIKGTYEHKMTSVHPYLAWTDGGINLWGSAGYGRGKLEIVHDGDKGNAKTTMLSLSGGVKRKLAPQGMSLKGDISLARTKIGELIRDGEVLAGETVKSQQFRLILESAQQRTLESGGTVTPVLEAGLRYDGGSGESGIGAILGAGIRFNDAVTGLTVEGKVYALLGRKDYTEWGVSGVILQQARADERGLSFSLSPSYGKTDSKAEKLWDQALPVGDGDNTDDYDMLVKVRLDYGLSAPGRNGLLIPYSEMTVGDESDRYLLGINWKRSPSFGIDVSGERKDSTKKYVLGTTWKGSIFDTKLTGEREESGTIKHRVLLESTIRF